MRAQRMFVCDWSDGFSELGEPFGPIIGPYSQDAFRPLGGQGPNAARNTSLP